MKLKEFESLIPAELEPVEVCLRHAHVTRCYLQRVADKMPYLIDAQGKASRYDHDSGKFVPDPQFDLKKQ